MSTGERLIATILEGLMVLNVRDQRGIPRDILLERSRNIACAILGNATIEWLPDDGDA
jgi:hypothetical protein